MPIININNLIVELNSISILKLNIIILQLIILQ